MNTKSVVIIDDDEELLNLLQGVLKEEGYKVRTYSSTIFTDLMERIHADLLILDMWFGDFNGGLTFAQALKIKPRLKNTPIILMSSDPEMKQYAQKVRAQAFLQKPIDFQELIATIRNLPTKRELSRKFHYVPKAADRMN